ncbi:MAG: lactonase family protein [Akkermansiaceae bacterium]
MKTVYTLFVTLITTASIVTMAAAATTTVFIGTGKKGIFTATLDQNKGTLATPVLAAEVNSSGFLVKHPKNSILYSTAEVEKKAGRVVAYKIEQEGKLTELNQQPTKGSKLCHVSLDSTGKILMGANYREGYVVSYPIQADGSIGKMASKHVHEGKGAHPKRQTKPHAHSIYSGPDNKYAYAPDLGIDKVMIYQLDSATAKLTSSGSAASPPGAGPRHMKFGKDGKQAYVLNELTLSISVYDRDAASGNLKPVQLVSTLPEGETTEQRSCSEIRVSQDGKFIYCANRDLTEQGRDSLSVFSVAEDGKITRIQTIGAEVWIPRNINLDPSGKWLLVAGQKSNDVPVFKIDPNTGILSYTGQEITVPTPMCIEFVPSS